MIHRISTDPADVQFDVVHKLLAGSYWSPNIRADVLRDAIANSIVCGAFDPTSGTQVGFARVVTDYATFAWLCDVIVDDAHRGRGIAKAMVAELHEHPKLQTLRRWCLATRDAHSLYTPMGYTPVAPGNWLERRMPTSVWQEAES